MPPSSYAPSLADIVDAAAKGSEVEIFFEIAPQAKGMVRQPALFHIGIAHADRQKHYESLTEDVHPLTIYRVPRGRLIGRGLVVTTSKVIMTGRSLAVNSDQLTGSGWTMGRNLTRLDRWPSRSVKVDYPIMPLLRQGDAIYGHWLIDIIPKAQIALERLDDSVRFVVPSTLPAFARTFLEAIGIDGARTVHYDEQNEILEAPALYVMSNVRGGNFFHPYVSQAATAKKISRHLGPSSNRSARSWIARHFCSIANAARGKNGAYFFSRGQWGKNARSLLNRDEIENLFRVAGYEILYPESLSLDAQVALYTSARIIAGESGSALHNSVFASPDLKVIALQSRSDGAYIQNALCENVGQRIGMVYGESFDRPGVGRNGQWLADPDAVWEAIARIGHLR